MSVTSAGAAAVRIRILLRRYAQDKKAKHPPPPAPRERTQARSAVAPTTTAHAPLPGILEKLDEHIAACQKEDKDRLEAASSKQPAAIYIRIAREVQRGGAGTCHGASGSSEWLDRWACRPAGEAEEGSGQSIWDHASVGNAAEQRTTRDGERGACVQVTYARSAGSKSASSR